MKKTIHLTSILLCLLFGSGIQAQLRLPAILRDSMILQRDQKVRIWGWASPGEKISLRFKGKVYKTSAAADSTWQLYLLPTVAGGPYNINITASDNRSLKDVWFGDVWFCSGQSNMVHQMNIHDVRYSKDIETANYPLIRQWLIPTVPSPGGPKADIPAGNWQPAVGEQVRPFSAVAYFFAKALYDKYRVPIGIINASVGGTPIEAWISEQGLDTIVSLRTILQQNKDAATAGTPKTKLTSTGNRTPPVDAGLSQHPQWFDTGYLPTHWRNINIPGYWEDQGLKDLNGTVWYRRMISVPSSMVQQAATLWLGRIVDADEVYINGTRVGSTAYQYPQRRYKIKAGILKAGENLFVIRVSNTNGKGGFVPDKPYCIFSGADTLDLKGTWQYKVGNVLEALPTSGPPAMPPQYQPAALYNGMVAPEIKYAIKGFCWYQGEANTHQPAQYLPLQTALIHNWRKNWKQGDLPFLYVQLPGYMDYNYLPSESQWAAFREAQLKTLATANTAMVVAIDLGEWNDIHPDNKQAVGERLALAAMKQAYNEQIVYSGPLYASSRADGNKILVSFAETGSGLITNDGEPPAEFAIAGEDKKFVWAQARIVGNDILVWNDAVPAPKYVRYAWADNPVNPNLYNKEGLPASPFRTDQ